MRKLFILCILSILLVCPFGQEAYTLEEPEPAHRLPPLLIPEIPLDDNPFSREVFSLKDLRGKNQALLERIIATRMDFPLMFNPSGKFARELFPNPERARFGKNFAVVIRMNPILWSDDSLLILKSLQSELAAQRLDMGRTGRDMRIEFLIFVKNHQVLHNYLTSFPDVSEEARNETADMLEQVFNVCKQVLEFKVLTLNGIRTLDEIDQPDQTAGGGNGKLQFERFVAESKGMKPEDVFSILEIRNPAQFKELCLERTSELLADSETENIGELLGSIGPSDAIVLASYFARDRIRAYKNPLDQTSQIPQGESEELQVGDCRHFAGLAIHYLNLVVKPNNPKLRDWHFGIERADIADYHHAYVLAAHIKKEDGREKIDLFFFDPVLLSSHSMGKLRAKDVRRLIDAASKDDHFFSVKRYGEDFVARKNRKKSLRDAPVEGQEIGEITLDPLLSDQ
jgi:hypothetical protein